jgi:hypothetical protein
MAGRVTISEKPNPERIIGIEQHRHDIIAVKQAIR